jgi:hypothetical protein
MRILGFLLILAGLGLTFGMQLYQSDFTGEQILRKRIYDRSIGGGITSWYPVTLDLSEQQNPLRIRLEGARADGGSYAGTGYPVSIELKGPEGLALSTGLDINLTSEGAGGNDEQRLYANAPDFDVIADGPHNLIVRPQLDRDISVLWMDVIFLANVQRPDDSYLRPGLITAGVGLAFWFLGGRRRRKSNRKGKSERRWGRR